MRTRLLGEMENDRCKADFVITLDYTDVAGFTDGAANAILSVPAGAVVSLLGTVLETPFAFFDGEVVGLNVELGDGGDTDRYLEATQMGFFAGYVTKTLGVADNGYAYAAADTVDIIFTVVPEESTTPNLSTCTAGRLHLYLSYHDLNKAPNS